MVLLNIRSTDLQVKVICNLRHDETSPIAKVCRQMQGLVSFAACRKQNFRSDRMDKKNCGML